MSLDDHQIKRMKQIKSVLFVLSVGKEKNQCNLCNPLTKKALLSSRTAGPGKKKIMIHGIYDKRCASLHIVVAQVVGCAQLVVDYILYNHILAIELFDDDIAVLRVWMHAADGIVRNPNRIVAILSINHKIPRNSLALICHRCHLGVVKRGNLVDDSLGKTHPCFSV